MKSSKKKRIIYAVIIIVIMIFSFHFDKNFYNEMKTTVVGKIKTEINKLKPNEDDPTIENTNTQETLKVYFLDVGQADSILLECNNEYMLIDAGNNADGNKLVKYFQSLNVNEFRYVFGTHAHEDHIGGLDNIIRNFKIKNFYMSGVTTTTTTFMEILDELEKKNLELKTPKNGQSLTLGDAKVKVLYVGEDKESLNDSSIVIRVTYGATSFLFMGDATTSEERLVPDKELKSTVLKVGHHGSRDATGATFLNKIKPKYAVISSGKNNEYGHPHDVTINKLNKINTKVYRTDGMGTIVATSDGKTVKFKTIQTDTNGVEN